MEAEVSTGDVVPCDATLGLNLRRHPEVAEEYGALKVGLAGEHGSDPNDRDAYRAGKPDWVAL
jgi:GrpB-like predicted nucleotidyltransferase (UPF0157 family)